MPDYRFETKSASGKVNVGVLSAPTIASASEILRGRGETIVLLQPADNSTKKPWYQASFSFGPGAKDIANFTSQLSVMLRAGISLRAAVEGIADQVENPRFREMLRQIQRDVESGKQFSEALQRYPKKFGSLYINMVRASELSGGLSKMLEKIAGYLNQQIETIAMVRGAMVYPGIIGTLAVGVTIFLLTWVLPRFMVIFKGKESVLPVPTKVLLALSDFMTVYWWVVIIGLVVSVWGVIYANTTTAGRGFFDTLKLKIPLFKKLFRALYISRGLHTMGQLLNAGVPMLDTISITADISGNIHYKKMWYAVHTAVKQGKKVSAPLASASLLPKSVVQMVSAGEESGKLGEVLDEVSTYYHKELVSVIKSVTSMIEPLMIVVMGGLVGFIAMSIILPIFKMSQLVK
ncbi:MAG: type II secretion system F family protein [Tepidisphaeraceae bacterium]